MSDTWREKLTAGRVLLLDGGTGTELRRRGFALRPDVWSALAPPKRRTCCARSTPITSPRARSSSRPTRSGPRASCSTAADLGGRASDAESACRRNAREARDASGQADRSRARSRACRRASTSRRTRRPQTSARRIASSRSLATMPASTCWRSRCSRTRRTPCSRARRRATRLPLWLGVSCRLSDSLAA